MERGWEKREEEKEKRNSNKSYLKKLEIGIRIIWINMEYVFEWMKELAIWKKKEK